MILIKKSDSVFCVGTYFKPLVRSAVLAQLAEVGVTVVSAIVEQEAKDKIIAPAMVVTDSILERR